MFYSTINYYYNNFIDGTFIMNSSRVSDTASARRWSLAGTVPRARAREENGWNIMSSKRARGVFSNTKSRRLRLGCCRGSRVLNVRVTGPGGERVIVRTYCNKSVGETRITTTLYYIIAIIIIIINNNLSGDKVRGV